MTITLGSMQTLLKPMKTVEKLSETHELKVEPNSNLFLRSITLSETTNE